MGSLSEIRFEAASQFDNSSLKNHGVLYIEQKYGLILKIFCQDTDNLRFPQQPPKFIRITRDFFFTSLCLLCLFNFTIAYLRQCSHSPRQQTIRLCGCILISQRNDRMNTTPNSSQPSYHRKNPMSRCDPPDSNLGKLRPSTEYNYQNILLHVKSLIFLIFVGKDGQKLPLPGVPTMI